VDHAERVRGGDRVAQLRDMKPSSSWGVIGGPSAMRSASRRPSSSSMATNGCPVSGSQPQASTWATCWLWMREARLASSRNALRIAASLPRSPWTTFSARRSPVEVCSAS
jgi:hypothetical protein